MDEVEQPFALVVDDDAMILLNACDILEAAGFQCLEAYNFVEAIDRLERHEGRITLLFSDVELGAGEDGFELSRETAKRWPDINILIASGRITPGPGEMPEGAIFISKPFSAHVVHARLHELLPEGQKPEPLKRKAI